MSRHHRVTWFKNLAERLGVAHDARLNLVVEQKIAQDKFQEMTMECVGFLAACLGIDGKSVSEAELLERAAGLANRTPNGIVLPKQEHQVEFNRLHRSVASWLGGLSIDDLINDVYSPVTLRLVKGDQNPAEEARPFASTKFHSDLWNGEPVDSVTVHIPAMGDIERTTVHYFHPPDDYEDHWFRVLDNYDEGEALESRSQRYPNNFQLGTVYFADTIAPHRTVKNQGKERVMIEFRLRRIITDEERQELASFSNIERQGRYVGVKEWCSYGTTQFMKFKDTYADAAKGIFSERVYEESTYDLVPRL